LRLHLQEYSGKRDASAQSKEAYSEEFVLFPLESPPFTPSSYQKTIYAKRAFYFDDGFGKKITESIVFSFIIIF
jgi:hypothetical protein